MNYSDSSVNVPLLMLSLALGLFFVIVQWKIFEKAGKPGWYSIIPIYSYWVLAEISGLPGWTALLIFIPFVGILAAFYILYMLPQRFGKSSLFGVGTALLSLVFLPILAFDGSRHDGVFGM